MSRVFSTVAVLVLLAGLPAWAQRSRRSAPPESLVQVTRSATLRVAISSDTMGIFDFLSDAQKLASWFPNQAVFEARFGGKYHFRWEGATGMWSGVVTQFIRGNTLAYTWQEPDEPFETNVQFKLFPQGAETLVELTHSGFTSAAAQEKAIKAWNFYLQNLKSVIEKQSDLRSASGRKTSRSLQP
jgi:uncharacterized protein YndB with AHSA1/START domain